MAAFLAQGDAQLSLAATRFFEDFDAPSPARRPAARPAPAEQPVPAPAAAFTAAELERARDDAYASGLAAGRANAMREAEAGAASRLEAFARALDDVRDEAQARIEAQTRALAQLLLAALAALFPAMCERHGPAEAAAVARALLPALEGESELLLQAAPDTLEAVRAAALAMPRREMGSLACVADPALAAGDVRLSWRHGAACRDGHGLLRAVLASLTQAGLAQPSQVQAGLAQPSQVQAGLAAAAGAAPAPAPAGGGVVPDRPEASATTLQTFATTATDRQPHEQ